MAWPSKEEKPLKPKGILGRLDASRVEGKEKKAIKTGRKGK